MRHEVHNSDSCALLKREILVVDPCFSQNTASSLKSDIMKKVKILFFWLLALLFVRNWACRTDHIRVTV